MMFSVAQLGARRHYAVPRALHLAGLLDHLYTDVCVASGLAWWARALPRSIVGPAWRRLAGRVPSGLPVGRVKSFEGFGVRYAWRRRRARDAAEATATHLWAGRRFCELVLRSGLPLKRGAYTFNSAALEILQAVRSSGQVGVLDQTITPTKVQRQLLDEEHCRFPAWEKWQPNPKLDEFADRERREWEAADLIVCGSEFVRDGIAECGGPVEKCVVVPYGVDALAAQTPKRKPGWALNVLFAGGVGLRKGAPHVLEAAKRLNGRARVRMVGPIGVSDSAATELREHVELTGATPRSEMRRHYEWADVFLLPSLCEGSATVCYEALAAGLPVITTPNAGSVVRDGVDGFIVPIRDSEAIVEKLERLACDPGLLEEMSRNAIERSKEFIVEKYGERLVSVLQSALAQKTRRAENPVEAVHG